MSTEWNNKLALSLRDPADLALEFLPITSLRSALLPDAATTNPPDDVPHRDWLTSAADRIPAAVLAQANGAAAGLLASGEVTHVLSAARKPLAAVDLDALRKSTVAVANEAAKRFPDDARKRWLWLWRYLPDRLAVEPNGIGAAVHRLPADPRVPDLSVWDRISFDGALASAAQTPTFLVAQVEPSLVDLARLPSEQSYATALRLHSHLAWQSALAIVEALGPDAILSPSLRNHPLCDGWLAAQGVTARKGDAPDAAPAFASFPSSFVSLVPQARAAELGDACAQRARKAWQEIADAAMGRLGKEFGVDTKDKTFVAIWNRQTSQVVQAGWVAVPWLADSAGAGGLLAKQDVSSQERWAKTHQDAAGLEDPWPGIYFGLWYFAAKAASDARRLRTPGPRLLEGGPRCTCCGEREALHASGPDASSGAAELWAALGSKGADVLAGAGEQLCAVCATLRLWGQATTSAEPVVSAKRGATAVVMFAPDQLSALRRGGKELRQGATLADLARGTIADALGKARGAAKDLLDSVSPLGPARLASIESALGAMAFGSIPALVSDAGGSLLYSAHDEYIAVVPLSGAPALIRNVRERMRQTFVELQGRLTLHPGPSTSISAVLVTGAPGTAAGQLARACRALMDRVARESLGGDSVVAAVQGRDGAQRVLGLRGAEFDALLTTLLAAFPASSAWYALLRAIRPIESALVNADVDKSMPDGRVLLLRDVMSKRGIRTGVDQQPADEDVARAVCAIIDRAVAQADGDAQRAMDGLQVAASLAGGDR